MGFTQKNIQLSMSGDKVVSFMTPKKFASDFQGVLDLKNLHTWYEEDPMRNHLGEMALFGQREIEYNAIFPELLKDRSVIEVGGDGTFTYDIPVYEEHECMTTSDLSHQGDAGFDGGRFKIELSEEFKPGDVLTFDPLYGEDLMVTEEEVVQTGTGFEHIVQLVSNDKYDFFPSSQLAAGISYYKINHGIFGEYGTNYSDVSVPQDSGSMRVEFQLGSDRGVEMFITEKADRRFNAAFASDATNKFLDSWQRQIEQMGGEIALVFDVDQRTGAVNPKTGKLASTAELLVHRELDKMTATSLMFQKAGKVDGPHGSTMFNEGLWHQMRRGKIIKYPRPQGMTRTHIAEAAEYIFRGNPMTPEQRRLMFEVGSQAYENFIDIFQDEVLAQLTRLNGTVGLFGDDGQLPTTPITGPNLQNLSMQPVRFTNVFLPGIGNVTVKRNVALDYMSYADRFSRGFHPYQKSHTTYSAIIYDATSSEYSNTNDIPEGAKLVENGNAVSNIYLVKPEGSIRYSGYEGGRYSPYRNEDILSSVKTRSVTYWAYNSCAIFIPDPSRFVMIELDPAGRKGYV